MYLWKRGPILATWGSNMAFLGLKMAQIWHKMVHLVHFSHDTLRSMWTFQDMPFKVQFASFITELWTLCSWHGLKSLKKGHFWWSGAFYSKVFGPKLLRGSSPKLDHAPGHWDALIWRNCENKSYFGPSRQKWPKTAKMASFDEAMLITRKLFRFEVPVYHSLIRGQYPHQSDALIQHICENGGCFCSLGAQIWPFWD